MPRLVNARIDVPPTKSNPTPRGHTDTAIEDVYNAVNHPASARAVRLAYGSPLTGTRKKKMAHHETPPAGGRPPPR